MIFDETSSICHIRYKIVFLGDMNVGKTSIIQRFVKDEFDNRNNPTVGIDFLSRNLTVNQKIFRLQLWDTAGQQKYKSLVPAYLRDCDCAVFVFDLSRQQSLENLKDWIALFREHKSADTLAILAGNKADIISRENSIAQETIYTLAFQQGLTYFQMSAKSGQNIQEMFKTIIHMRFDQKKPHEDPQEEQIRKFVSNYQKIKGTIQRRSLCCYV